MSGLRRDTRGTVLAPPSGVGVFCVTFGLLIALTLVASLRSYRIRSDSMTPTLLPGDLVLGEVVTPDFGWFYRDQLYAFRLKGRWLIKRLVGGPGDAIALQGCSLYRQGLLASEPAVRYLAGGGKNLPALVVPPERAVLLGDNRDHSEDSRHFGTVPLRRHGGRILWRLLPLRRFGPVR